MTPLEDLERDILPLPWHSRGQLLLRVPLLALLGLLALSCASSLPVPTTGSTAPPPTIALPTHGEIVRLVAVGDTGDGPARVIGGIARVHAAAPVDAILLLGDNFYPCGVPSENDPRWDEIRKTFSTLGVPIYPVLGNHDYGEPARRGDQWVPCQRADPAAQLRAGATVPHWIFPARSYLLRSNVVDVAMIDTSPIAYGFSAPSLGGEAAGDIVQQLRTMLDQMSSDPHPPRWRFVAGHHTVVSSGVHGQLPGAERRRLQALLPLLRGSSVDLYLCGHDHHLELIEDKPLFLISGAGSDPRPMIRLMAHTLFPDDTRKRLGFAVIEVTPYQLSVTFHDAAGEAISTAYAFPKLGP